MFPPIWENHSQEIHLSRTVAILGGFVPNKVHGIQSKYSPNVVLSSGTHRCNGSGVGW